MTMEMLLPSQERASRDRGSRRRSTLVSRNVTVDGHRTSVRLEPAMWDALTYVCQCERKSLHGVVSEIARGEMASSLTAAIRVFLMSYFRAAAAASAPRRHEQI